MIIYSKKIFLFLNEIQKIVKHILEAEMGLRVFGNRFYDAAERYSYPIKVVVFNNKKMLGYFDSDFYELGFHETLMYVPKTQLWNVIRHEIAHYLAFNRYQNSIYPHGVEFKNICRELKWGEEVAKASIMLDITGEGEEHEASSVLRKIEKLMALTTSSNPHEAEQALIKSQQLLLKHNLESKYLGAEEEDKIVLKRILKQKRENARMQAIAQILDTFFVSIVYTRGGEYIYLEILGTAVNVEIAEYVAGVLEQELERLWEQAQTLANLRGTIAKNSFFLGIAKGYCNKVKSLMRANESVNSHHLMVIEKQLTEARQKIYRKLTTKKSSRSHCQNSSMLGELMGKNLSINLALNQKSKSSEALISFEG